MFHIRIKIISPTSQKLVSSLGSNPWLWLASRLISTSSPSSASKGNSFAFSYLTHTCGFSPERAITISKRLKLETSEKPDTVIEFFKNQGLSQTMISKVLRTVPDLLLVKPENTLQPKFDFFKSKGFSVSDIHSIILTSPEILKKSLNNEIIPGFNVFENMFECKHNFMKTVVSYSGLLHVFAKRIEPNIKLLREEGVPESHIVRLLEYFGKTMKACPTRFKKAVEEVKEMKTDPLKLQFVIYVHIKLHLSKSTWERKKGIYRKWGWTEDDISKAFRTHPFCMCTSDSKIEAVMDFLVNTLGCKSSDIIRCPSLLTMSLRKRIIPRGSVVKALLSKGLIKKLSWTVFRYNELEFLDKCVHCYDKEANELLKLYRGRSLEQSRCLLN
ncbi:uncharacterized protein LOC130973298 isoform X2 [Arachis stenosperma]|uniref:uncharacterized protein LOC130973298 isoform X2 n=1 Tax=Arachis stenosperma TaxID=217475 RepID=UPI0025AD6F74|nr:uncharacterized protein LOC130973298 isoform X2 [Arachis stenosperma]